MSAVLAHAIPVAALVDIPVAPVAVVVALIALGRDSRPWRVRRYRR